MTNVCSEIIEYIEIVNPSTGTADAAGDMLVLSEVNSNIPVIYPRYTAENIANKKNDLTNPNTTGYTSTIAVYNALLGKSDIGITITGYTNLGTGYSIGNGINGNKINLKSLIGVGVSLSSTSDNIIFTVNSSGATGFVTVPVFNQYTGTTVPNTYYNKSQINLYTGTTVPNTYYNKFQINSYTGNTNIIINSIKSNGITGATNLGTGTTIYSGITNNKLTFKSFKQAGGIVITSDNNSITFSGVSTADLQKVTEIGAETTIESTFSGGLVIPMIRPIADSTTAITINKTDGITPVISIDTLSGFTGHGTIEPKGLVHAYGIDAAGSVEGTQTNAFIIDGNTDVDKDINWSDEGVPKWLAEIYREENGRFWYLYNVESGNSPLTIDNNGRIGQNKNTNILNYHAAQLSGDGTNDLVISGIYTQNYNTVYEIKISGNGNPDRYQWRKSVDDGITYGAFTSDINCDLSPYELEYGVFIQFENLTGHTVGDVFGFAAFTQIPQATYSLAPLGFQEVATTDDYTGNPTLYNDITALANGGNYQNSFTIFKTGVTGTLQAFYWGTPVQTNGIYFNLDEFGESLLLITEFWDGTSWYALNGLTHNYLDATNNLTQSGRLVWSPNTMTNWNATYLPDLVEEGYELYWLRIRTTTNATKSPKAKSISVGNDKRLAIYSSFNDYKPSMYVDSLGRVSVGGGNITGKNLLQITRSFTIPPSTSLPSLVEIDSEDSSAIDLRIRLSSNDNISGGINIGKSRGTLSSALNIQSGDSIGHYGFRGILNNLGFTAGCIENKYYGDGNTTKNSDFIFHVSDSTTPVEALRLSSIGAGFGHITSPSARIHIQSGTTSIAPLKFISGNLLSIPQAGAVEFQGNSFYGTTTGGTRKTFAYTDSFDLATVTAVGACTNIETTLNGGIITNRIRPTGNSETAFQITKANGITPIINVNSNSGLTGFGTICPRGMVHTYGTNTGGGIDSSFTQTNAVIVDGVEGADKDINWSENGQAMWLADTYRNEKSKFWYLYNVSADNVSIAVTETGRVGFNKQPNTMKSYSSFIGNAGLDDMFVTGVYNQNYNSVFEVEIISTGAIDTYHWRKSIDGGLNFNAWSSASGCTTGATAVNSGVEIYFNSVNGHTVGSKWQFGGYTQAPDASVTVAPIDFKRVITTTNFNAPTISYTDITGLVNGGTNNTFIVFNTGSTSQAVYWGNYIQTDSIYVSLITYGVGIILITEYWNGSAWIALTNATHNYIDNTDSFTKSGSIIWTPSTMSDWAYSNIPDYDAEFYWMRIRTSTSPTISPIVNSISIGTDKRFAVYSSYNNYLPSFIVDSTGRVNIGGGNITGKNLLQINNTNYTDLTCGQSNSLFEIDSNCSDVANIRIRTSSDDSVGSGLVLVNSRGTLQSPTNLLSGDSLGHICFRGYANNNGVTLTSIESEYVGNCTTCYSNIIFKTSSGSIPTEKIRISSNGTGFGITAPTATIHLKAGTTSIAPLRFTSGALLNTPQSGAIEYLGNDYYGTTSGNTRKTFAFLESPMFTGNPNLPIGTCLNNINLYNLINNSGGTNNNCLVKTCTFNSFTANTGTQVVTGVTNGLSLVNKRVKLGGNLSEHTIITGNTFDFTISSNALNLCADSGILIQDTSGSGIDIHSNGSNVVFRGNNSSGVEKLKLLVSDTQATITDSRALPRGFEYNADYSLTYTSRSLVDRDYVDNKSAGLNPLQAVLVATTGNTNLVSAPATIDSVTLSNGNRVLVKNQISGATNGIYVFNGAGSAMTRSLDFDTSAEVVKNSYVAVTSGATNQNTSWILNTPNPITIGVTPLTFVLFSSQAGVVQGNGICVTQGGGNYIVATKSPANSSLCSDASGIYVNSSIAGTGLQYSSGVINLCGNALAGNSLSWTGTQFAVNISGGTLNSALNSKLNTSAYSTYTGTTAPSAFASKSFVSTYTGTTAPAAFASKSFVSTYTGTTVPNTYYSKTQINNYTGTTNNILIAKAYLSGATFTGKVCVCKAAQNDNTNCAASTSWYICQGATALPLVDGTAGCGTSNLFAREDHIHPTDTSRLATSAYSTYTGTTAPSAFASKSFVSTYTGTTVPNTYYSKTQINNYTGTTVPNTYYTKTQINNYTGTTNNILTAKAYLSGATFTGKVCVCKAAQNDNTNCAASTSWYISQGATALPLVDGTAGCGTSNLFARQDHIHPTDTSRLATSAYSTYTGTTVPNTYYSKTQINNYTGTTAPAAFASKSFVSTYTGTTAPAAFASKSFVSTYTGTTAPAAFASKSFVSTYTGTTAPAAFASKSFVSTYTGTTVPNTYYSKTQINNYTGTTAPAAFASKSFVSTYTGTTAPSTFASKSFVSTYTGTTVPNTYYSKTQINNYTGTTAPAAFASKSFLSTYTGTTAPSAFASKSFVSTYTGTTVPNTYYSKTQINNYTGTTAPAAFASKSFVSTYTGTTAPSAFASKSFVSTYTGTTVPNTYYSKTQINNYTGTTAPAAFASKSFLSTYTGTTAPSAFASKSFVSTYTGTTVPNTYYSKTQINNYTGTTAPAAFASKSFLSTYTGTTAPVAFASKVNAITGATNLSGGTAIYTSVSGNKIQLKSIKTSGSITISSDATSITIGGSGGSGSTSQTISATFILGNGTPITTGTNKTNILYVPKAGTITKVLAYAKTAPTGADAIFDINKNGTSIWNSTQANRIKIIASSNTGSQTSFDTTALLAEDILTIDIDQIGSTIAGQDITLQVFITT